MRALILAAGTGNRLHPLTADKPKTLIPIGGAPILDHQRRLLAAAGVTETIIVTGWQAHTLHAHVGARAHYVHNRRFRSTNSLYSLWSARRWFDAPLLVLNSDVLFHPDIVRRLLADPAPDALAIDFRAHLGEEEMKVRTRDGIITAISKDMPPAEAEGENVGIIKFSVKALQRVVEIAQQANAKKEYRHWVPYSVHALAGRHPFRAVSIGNLPWIEIDYRHDLDRAEKVVLPKILKALKVKSVK